MIALLQRVLRASVEVDGRPVAAIGKGLLALVGVERADTQAQAERLLERLLGFRMFGDAQDRMNLDLTATGGELLLVPQFTLAADTSAGNRPSFTPAAPPAAGARLFAHLCNCAREQYPRTATGMFGAHMQIALVNDGPVTFWLQVRPPQPSSGAAASLLG